MPVGLPPTLEIRPVPLDTNRTQAHAQDLTRGLHENLLRSQRQGMSRNQLEILRERRHIDIMARSQESVRSHLDITRVQESGSRGYDRSRSHYAGRGSSPDTRKFCTKFAICQDNRFSSRV